MPVRHNIKLKIERFLYKKGFTEAPLRAIIFAQLYLLALSLTLGLIFLFFSIWPICFFLGAALITFNFWSMSRFILEQLPGGYSARFLQGQLFRSLGRLIITGAVLTAALYFGASPFAMLFGMLACMAVIGITGAARHKGHNRR